MKLMATKGVYGQGALLFYLLFFTTTRLPYFIMVSVPYMLDDARAYVAFSSNFFGDVQLISRGTLGFPLFLRLLYELGIHELQGVVVVQTALAAFSGLYLMKVMYEHFSRGTFLYGVLGLIIFQTSLLYVHFESTILTESLFNTLTLVLLAQMIQLLYKPTKAHWAIASVALGYMVFVRLTGLVFVPILMAIYVYSFVNKRFNWSMIIAGLLPVSAMIFGMMYYHYSAMGLFTLAPRSEGGRLSQTMSFVEKSPSFPSEINDAIDEFILSKTNPQELAFLERTDDLQQANILYLKYQSFVYPLERACFAMDEGGLRPLNHYSKMIAEHAISEHPDKYRKLIIRQFRHYYSSFHHNNTSSYPFFKSFEKTYADARIRAYFYSSENKTHRLGGFKTPRLNPDLANKRLKNISKSSLARLASGFFDMHHRLFRNYLWIGLQVISLLASFYLFIRSRFSDPVSFLVLLIVALNVGSMILISIGNMSMIRYNYTMHFTYYMAPIVLFSSFRRITELKKG